MRAVRRYGGRAAGCIALAISLFAALPPSRLAAQCPDGSPPPCRGVAARPAAPDSHVIAVLPFRVSGADTSLAEGLAELLAVEFTGEGTPRAADMGSVLRAWRNAGGGAGAPLELAAARRMAARLGAGRILTASVVATGRQLSVSAQVLGTGDGGVTARAGPVRGSADSLPDLLHAIAGQLIAMPAGAGAGFAGVPTEAIRAYIAGRSAYRRADWAAAARQFERALQLDSTFAYAAVGRLDAEGWEPLPTTDLDRIRRLAWANRSRLDPVSAAMLSAKLGQRYPEPQTVLEELEGWETVTRLAPDNADGWFFLGDALAHRGALVGIDALARARVAFERALQVDPGQSESALHLSSIGILTNDRELTRRYGPLAMRLAPGTPTAVGMEVAWGEGRETRARDSLVRAMPALPMGAVTLIPVYMTAPEMMDTVVVEASYAERARRATTLDDRRAYAASRYNWLLNRGRPLAADSQMDVLTPLAAAQRRVMYALFSGAEDSAGAEAMRSWPGTQQTPRDECLRAMWWVQHGDTASAGHELTALRAGDHGTSDIARWCGPMIEAGLAVGRRSDDARRLVARADSIIAQGNVEPAGWEGLALGRLWAALGDFTAATRAVRRREWFGSGRSGSGVNEAERMRAEGRWAALAGDTAGARVAYRRYLLLRAAPEPSRMPQRDSVVAELAALGRGR